jgi:hypothetical protein
MGVDQPRKMVEYEHWQKKKKPKKMSIGGRWVAIWWC